MSKKLIYRGCPKCRGTLSRTGEMRKRRVVDSKQVALVEYACLSCSKHVELEQTIDRGDFTKYA